MAARSKKKVSQPEAGQESQDVALESVAMSAGLPPELAAADESSEGAMNINAESIEAQASVEAVEPFVNLEPNLSIQNAVKLYDRLKKAYSTYDAIEIDASHVNSVDTASLQLFVALKKDAIKNKKQVDFFQPSARFIESARLLDLLDILEITHV